MFHVKHLSTRFMVGIVPRETIESWYHPVTVAVGNQLPRASWLGVKRDWLNKLPQGGCVYSNSWVTVISSPPRSMDQLKIFGQRCSSRGAGATT